MYYLIINKWYFFSNGLLFFALTSYLTSQGDAPQVGGFGDLAPPTSHVYSF